MTKAQSKTETVPPIEHVRVGLVQAAIWKKDSDHRPYYEVTFQRSYRDANGAWHYSRSFSSGHLLALAKVADLAHSRILALQEQDAPSELPDDIGQ